MSRECLNCDKRHPGCHGSCESYQKYRAELDAERKARRKARHKEWVWDQYTLDRERAVGTRLTRRSQVFKSKRK